jgi:hypothetical protein
MYNGINDLTVVYLLFVSVDDVEKGAAVVVDRKDSVRVVRSDRNGFLIT